MARVFVRHLGLSVKPFWCNTWFDYFQNDGGIFRNTFSSDPVSPAQPQAAYYVLRTLCTVMDGAEPKDLDVSFSRTERPFDHWGFSVEGGSVMMAVWLPGKSSDDHPGVLTDVVIRGVSCGKVVGIDTLNGLEQELQFEHHDEIVAIPRVVIRDYPLLIKLSAKKSGHVSD
jgi:hypothetical protein